jgi:hypothetical protein
LGLKERRISKKERINKIMNNQSVSMVGGTGFAGDPGSSVSTEPWA